MELDGKIALVTGAGRGIGKAASLKYAENGADLIIADINEDLIEQTALEVKNIGRNCITVKVDVGDLESIDNMISTAKDQMGGVDILFNNAGITKHIGYFDITGPDWDRINTVNAKGAFFCMQKTAKLMVDQGRGGRIVNTASIAGKGYRRSSNAAYAASKGSVIAMTYICAGYLAEYDINVNAVCPGIVKTDMLAGILSGRSGDVSVNMDELESNMTSEVPLGRANEADVIFGIGCSFAITGFGLAMPSGKTYIHATLDPQDLNKDVQAKHALIGDAKLTLQALLKELGDAQVNDRGEVATQISQRKEKWLSEWSPKLLSEEIPISPYRVINELMKVTDPDETIITHDAGSPRDQLSPFWISNVPLSYIGWGKTTQLGYGLGLAMGAKLAQPGKLCINVWGDAAIGFTGMDFETAVRERIPILSILLNNFSMAIEIPIMQEAQAKYGSTDISGNYADMAKAFGGYGERITDPQEIAAAIERGIQKTREGTPALLEFITAKELTISK